MGKGGGAPTQTSSTVQNTNVPEYARPYVENMLGATQQQLFKMDGSNITGFQPYKAYGGTYDEAGNQTAYDPSKAIAGFSPLQQQAQQGIGGLQVPGEFGTASNATQNASNALYGTAGQAGGYGAQGMGYGAMGAGLGMQGANAGNMYAQQATNPNAVQAYMSPYMQNVVDVQKREAARQSGIQGTQQQAQAAQAGAFGGGRDAIMRAERERNLAQQMGDIQAQGSQNAFQQAQAAQQFGANLGLQGLQTGMQGTAQGLQGAQVGLQGVGAQQAGYNQAMQGASQLANIGNQGLQAQQGIYGLQNQVGQQQQLNQQQVINQAMQDYANAQQYPLMQLGTMSNMLRGLPMQAQTTQQYQAQANPITQGIGAIGSLGSLAQVKAEGGAVKSMASGGITSIPRYDVGGAVVSQLATMPDEALKKEAMESPSPRVREMAAAILKQRQAGLQTEPQAAEAPQGVGPMGVDYNANYAGGGIIAFATGEKVDAEKAARLAKQTEMYVAGAKLAAEQRAAEEQAKAAAQPASRGVPTLLDRNAPPYEEATSMAGRLADTVGSGVSSVARGITDKWDALSAMREQNQKSNAAIPGFFESLTPTQRAERAAQEKAANEEYKKIYTNKFQPFGSKPIGDSSGFKAYVGPQSAAEAPSSILTAKPPPLLDKDAPAYTGPTNESTDKRVPVVVKKGPAVVKDAGPVVVKEAAVVPAAEPAGIAAVPPATAPATAPAIDPLADARTTLKSLQDTANKSQEDIYKENLAAMKAQGLDTSEARQQYMKDQMAQRANIEKDAQNKEYLRRAQFFAQWGSTPGNTLVAGMAALKERIPDIIQDAADKRLALQQADKAIYELGEATRMEKLGQWEKAAAQKLEAAKTAATLQAHITQAAASIRGHELSKEGTIGAAGISAVANVESHRIMAAAGVQGHQIMAAAQNYHTEAQMKANALSAQNTQFAQGSSLFTHANDTLKDLNNKLATVLNTGEAQRLQETIKNAAALPDNKLLQDQAKAATTALNRITKPIADAVVAQQAIVDQTGQRVFGKDWKTATPVATSTLAPPPPGAVKLVKP
jgi:hypothetical protein